MKYHITDLIDAEQLHKLLWDFYKLTGIPTLILDTDGNYIYTKKNEILGTKWQNICINFHRIHPETNKNCIESDTILSKNVKKDEKFTFYKCKNGLIDAAIPIKIKNKHLANLFTGQFFFEKPDTDFFKKQGLKYKFDENKYLKALSEVPIISKEKTIASLEYLAGLAEIIANSGLKNLEQKLLNEKLKESEEKFKAFFENNKAIMFQINPETNKIIKANHAAVKFYKYSEKELLKKTIGDLNILPKEEIKKKIDLAIKEKSNYFIFKHKLANGELKDVEVYTSPIMVGGKLNLFSIIHDITERSMAEKCLKESKKTQDTILDAFDDGTYLCSSDYEILYLNPAMEKNIGRSAIGEKCHKAIYNNDEICKWCYFEELKKKKKKKITIETVKNKKNYSVTSVLLNNNSKLTVYHNITLQKQTEENFKTQQYYLEKAQQIGNFGSYIIDAKTGMWQCSEYLETIFGIGKNYTKDINGWISLIHPEFKNELYNYFQNEVLKQKKPFNKIYRIVSQKEKKEKWVHGYGQLEFDKAGNPVKMIGVIQDITIQKKQEQLLYETSQKLALYIEQTPLAVIGWDINFKITQWNKAAIKIFGFTEKEAIGKTKEIIVNPKDYEKINRIGNQLITTKKTEHSINSNITKTGQSIFCEWYNTPLVDVKGKVIGIISLVMDITKHKQNELERQKLFTAIKQSPTTIVITDTAGRIEYVNPQFTKLTGYSFAEAINKNPRILKSGKTPKDVYNKLWDTITNGNTWNGEFINKKKNGEEFIEHAVITPVLNNSGKIINYIAIKQDITEQKQAESNLRNKTRALRILSDANLAISQCISEKELLESICNLIVYEGGYKYALIAKKQKNRLKTVNTITAVGKKCNCIADKISWGNNEFSHNPISKSIRNSKIYVKKINEDKFKPWIKEDGANLYVENVSLPITIDNEVIGSLSICPTSTGYFTNSEIELFAQLVYNLSFGITSVRVRKERDKKNKELLEKSYRLIESGKEFRNLFNSASDAILIQDIKSQKFIEANKKALQMYGYSKEKFLSLNPTYLLDKKEIDNYKDRFINVVNKGSLLFKTYHKNSNGKFFPVEVSNKKIKYHNKDVILSFIRDITEREKIHQQIYTTAINAEEKERSRIAKDLHDGISPILSTIKLFNQALRNTTDEQIKNKLYEKIEYSIDQSIQSLSEISNNISPHILQNFGLSHAIEKFVNYLNEIGKIELNFSCNIRQRFEQNTEIVLYRTTTELINNGFKHSNATNIDLNINTDNKNNVIILIYKDNGKGFNLKKSLNLKNGMGLFNLINRIHSLKGTINFENKNGTIITITVPFQKQ